MAKKYGLTINEFSEMSKEEQDEYLRNLQQQKQQTINIFSRGVNQTTYDDLSNPEKQIYDNTTSDPTAI